MSYKLCITEKPSVARDIARILGADARHDGYFEGNGYCVTWTFGHLCELKEPADYTEAWKHWSLSALPMIPERFGIRLKNDTGIKKQFGVIRSLAENAESIINCGDAGPEGELIQRWVMQKAGVKCPVSRLWISSLTDEAIRKGFSDIKPQSEYTNLYYAGMSRAIGDWVLGMNATRLYTIKYSRKRGNILSVGRVQTPTLAIIVERQRAIENFKPEPYWELKTFYRDVSFRAASGKFKTAEDARKVLADIDGKPFSITDVTEKKGREAPPRLFDLTSLQVECNKRWGWTADEALKLIQSLYEKKVTTYPRVDTTYLPTDVYPKVPGILQRMTPYANFTEPLMAKALPKSKKVFDNSKITDHHAIIPTGEDPRVLVGNERLMYHLIAMRFIAAFYPDCIFSQTTVTGQCEKYVFKATGKVILEPGWRTLFADDKKAAEDTQADGKEQEKDADNGIMPAFTVGESGPHKPALAEKMTQPPKPYTEGTLLRAMETAGQSIEDEELREAMKENGIGRPSTRSAIIETLFRRGYLTRQRKTIWATQAGCDLIDIIRDDLVKSPRLTGIWENKLRRIEQGSFTAQDFLNELKEMVGRIVLNVLNDNSGRSIETITEDSKAKNGKAAKNASTKAAEAKSASATAPKAPRKPAVRKLEQIPCPLCGQGHIIKGRTAYGCSRFREGCSLRLMFTEYPDTLTPGKLNALITKNFKK